MISKSKIGKIITSSLLCFSFGTVFTSLTVASIGNVTDPSGTGGLETSTQPVFLADYSDFMAVEDLFPIDYSLDPDYLPLIEIAEEDLIYQDFDDDSFISEREIVTSVNPNPNHELFVDSDNEFNNLDTRQFSFNVVDSVKDVETAPEVTDENVSEGIVYQEEDKSETIVTESESAEIAKTVEAVEEKTESASEIALVEDDLINPVITETTTEILEDLSRLSDDINVPDYPELTYQIYRVKKDDTIGEISRKYGLDNDTLFSVNEIKNTRGLSIGTYLKIPSMKGLLYTVKTKGTTSDSLAKKFKVDAEKCARINHKGGISEEFAVGTTIFIPDAKLDNDTRSEIEGILWKKPLRNKYRVTSPYGWRTSPFNASKRSYHTGIDLALPSGNPIYSASPGTVIAVGYSGVYGNYVKVQHAGGYQTLYAHMSTTIAKKGQYVDTNTIIGKVGSTGQSTGPHLHFTLFRNGQTINPSSTGLYF